MKWLPEKWMVTFLAFINRKSKNLFGVWSVTMSAEDENCSESYLSPCPINYLCSTLGDCRNTVCVSLTQMYTAHTCMRNFTQTPCQTRRLLHVRSYSHTSQPKAFKNHWISSCLSVGKRAKQRRLTSAGTDTTHFTESWPKSRNIRFRGDGHLYILGQNVYYRDFKQTCAIMTFCVTVIFSCGKDFVCCTT